MARLMGLIVILDLCCAYSIKSNFSTEVLFLIVSQDNSYSSQLALQLKSDIIKQTQNKGNPKFPHYYIDVHLLNEFYKSNGDWTLLPALYRLTRTQADDIDAVKSDQQIYIKDSTKWIIICEERTHVSLEILLIQLSKLNHSKPIYLGHALYDLEAKIIHHFAFHKNPSIFPYPMLRSGVIFSYTLLQRIAALFHKIYMQKKHTYSGDKSKNNNTLNEQHVFHLDSAHELALFIYNNLETNTPVSKQHGEASKLENNIEKDYKDTSKEKTQFKVTEELMARGSDVKEVNTSELTTVMKGIILQDVPFICGADGSATYKSNSVTMERWRLSSYNNGIQHKKSKKDKEQAQTCAMQAKSMVTCPAVNRAQVYFAIKTCHQYHEQRIPIIEATWAPFTVHKRYYSDKEDQSIPTIDVNIPNTEEGHCEKTIKILWLSLLDIEKWNNDIVVANKSKSIKWLVLADDDTLLRYE